MPRIDPGNAPFQVQVGGNRLVNSGPGDIVYGDDQNVTVSSYDGVIAAGSSLTYPDSLWVLAPAASAQIAVVADAPPSAPALGQRLATFGHSYNDPNFPVGVTLRKDLFGSRLAAMLGMVEDNYCVAGTYAIQGTGNMYDRISVQLPALPTAAAAPLRAPVNAAVIYVGHNDISPSLQPSIAAEPSILIDFLRASIRALRAGQRAHIGAAPMVLAGGTWGTNSSASWFGGSTRFATTNGWTWTLTLPSTFPGGQVEIVGIRQLNTGAVHTITIDGQAAASWDTRGATQAMIRPTTYTTPVLSAGTHTIQGTIGNIVGGVEHLHYWQIVHPDPPPVVFANVCRTPAAANGQTDGVVATFLPLYRQLAAEFTDGRVVLIEADAIFNKATDMFGDGTHPSVKGAAAVAEVMANALGPLLNVRDRSSIALDQVPAPGATRAVMTEQITGADPASGTVTLAAGAVTLTNRRLQSDSLVLLTPIGAGTGVVSRGTITATNSSTSGSVPINSSDAADTRVVQYQIIQKA
jgi:lysophospholipase L1-like esterase